MAKMEQKQIQVPVGGMPKKEYQVYELNGIKFDYFDMEVALHGISSEILRYQASIRAHPEFANPRYDGLLHMAEEKFQYLLNNMERPPEDEIRPAGEGIDFPAGAKLLNDEI